MGLFDIFKSKKRREYEYFLNILNISTEIFVMIKRRKESSDIGIIDFDFDKKMMESNRFSLYLKYGDLDFISKDNLEHIIQVFNSDESDEDYKRNLNISYHFLQSFNIEMKKIVEKRKL